MEVVWLIVSLSPLLVIAGFMLGRGWDRSASPRDPFPSDAGCIDATLHTEVIDVLTAAARTPALAHRRQQIEQILEASGFKLEGCASGRCRPRRRAVPKFSRNTFGE